MHLNLVIRKMKKQDIIAVQRIARQSWYQTYEKSIPIHVQERFLNFFYNRYNLESRMNDSLLYVAEFKGDIVGFAHFSHLNKFFQTELGALYLLPDYQRRGIGTALLKYGIQSFKGLKEVILYVEKSNKNARNFYEAFGFKKIRKVNDFIFDYPVQTIQMRLQLSEIFFEKENRICRFDEQI